MADLVPYWTADRSDFLRRTHDPVAVRMRKGSREDRANCGRSEIRRRSAHGGHPDAHFQGSMRYARFRSPTAPMPTAASSKRWPMTRRRCFSPTDAIAAGAFGMARPRPSCGRLPAAAARFARRVGRAGPRALGRASTTELCASGERSRGRTPHAPDGSYRKSCPADGAFEPRDRPAGVSIAPDRRIAPLAGLPEARRHLAGSACRRARRARRLHRS